jgi:hypothetical protein
LIGKHTRWFRHETALAKDILKGLP